MTYDHKKIDQKWQKRWEDEGAYKALDDSDKEKYYCLIEFPYPSGAGLHIGHPRSYVALDILARKKRMDGYNVLYPIGWDAFGLPTENFAIKTGRKPQDVTRENIGTFTRQLKALGISFDWSREVNTTDPKYYKWTQWMFLEFFRAGLAYKSAMPINWCVSCRIGLANEEVVSGKCERCGGEVEKRNKEQWMIAITKYADKLLEGLEEVDYLPSIKKQQQDWIGRSEGAEVEFEVKREGVKPRVAVIDGFMGNCDSNWKPWIRDELEKRGYSPKMLALPNSSSPDIDECLTFLNEELKDFGPNDIVVGHSLGGYFAARVAQEKDLGSIILVAPTTGRIIEPGPKMRVKGDFVALKNTIANRVDVNKIKAKHRILFFDKTDDKVPFETIKDFDDSWTKHISTGKGHFATRNNVLNFPELLAEIAPSINIFTTRPDTLFGATYMVLAPEHKLVKTLDVQNREEVDAYVREAIAKSDIDRGNAELEKTGVPLKGVVAINPVNGDEIPVWTADYVMMGYGTGAIMAVPGHDERDWAFAKKFGLEIREVVKTSGSVAGSIQEGVGVPQKFSDEWNDHYRDDGKAVNSGFLNGLSTREAKKKIITRLEDEKKGKATVNYKLRDWVFSRQRYWGEPIPLIHCEKCDWVPVPEFQLPVVLPDVEKYEPTEDGESPLAMIEDWVQVDCPECGGPGRRETDTMPNWAGSSWYFLRYIDPHNDHVFADKEKLAEWMPVDWYNGGMEHVTLHLLYSRFWNRFLYDRGHVPVAEPYRKRTAHGMILAEDGTKMSKSRGNVINPDEIVQQHGADTLRVYEMFVGPFDQSAVWSTASMMGVRKFLKRVMEMEGLMQDTEPEFVTRSLHKTIKKVGEDIEALRFNTAVASMMVFVNDVGSAGKVTQDSYEQFLRILHPFAPHVTEEVFQGLGGELLTRENWPVYDQDLVVDDTVTLGVQVNGKVRGDVTINKDASEQDAREAAQGNENVMKHLAGKDVKKFVYVPGRIINFVI